MYILLGPHLGGRAAPWWPARRDLVNLGRRWARLDGQADAEDEARAGAEALDVLANCAGGFWKQPSGEDTPEDERDRVVDLNPKTVLLCAQTVIPTFPAAERLDPQHRLDRRRHRVPRHVAALRRGGVHPLTRVLALEFGPLGVPLNAIAPGTTASERVVAVRTKEQFDEIASMTALSRIGEVLDLANRILFLATPESGYLTGNGGRAML